MSEWLRRSIDIPVREELTYSERWDGPDKGLIWCWENGRLQRTTTPKLAKRADSGELIGMSWKKGTLQYLAAWQGIRGQELNLNLTGEEQLTCTKTKKESRFKRGVVPDAHDGS